jgi:hypothetical protein
MPFILAPEKNQRKLEEFFKDIIAFQTIFLPFRKTIIVGYAGLPRLMLDKVRSKYTATGVR